MAVTATNLVLGPGTLYVADFGATEPEDTAILTPPDSGTYRDVGGTSGGLQLVVDQTYSQLTVDQIVDNIESRLTGRSITLVTQMAEITLDNLALALNTNAGASGAGFSATLDIAPANSSATKATYRSLIMDGFGPDQGRRRIIVRKALSTAQVQFAYQKDSQTFYTVTFTAHWVDATTAMVHMVDE